MRRMEDSVRSERRQTGRSSTLSFTVIRAGLSDVNNWWTPSLLVATVLLFLSWMPWIATEAASVAGLDGASGVVVRLLSRCHQSVCSSDWGHWLGRKRESLPPNSSQSLI